MMRRNARSLGSRFARRARYALAAVPFAEIAQAGAIVGGWAAITWGVATLTVWQAWPLSAGAFLLSLAGWRFLVRLFRDGLYVLATKGRR